MYFLYIILSIIISILTLSSVGRETPESSVCTVISELPKLVKNLPPDVRGKKKGDGGVIGIVGGAAQHAGAPYFTAITVLKSGADSAFVMAPKEASIAMKTYAPDFLVFPYFNSDTFAKVIPIIQKSDVIIIGPGLGEEEEAFTLAYDVINICKSLGKPLVIDADGLLALAENPSILKDYSAPVILTPNYREANSLIKGMAITNNSNENWYEYWGKNVSVLLKGETDQFFSNEVNFEWSSNEGGSPRRSPGQGDILAGALGTFFNWALKDEALISDKQNFPYLSQSVATYAAAKLTRHCNSRAFEQYGRSLIPSNMVDNIHLAFKDVFEK